MVIRHITYPVSAMFLALLSPVHEIILGNPEGLQGFPRFLTGDTLM